MAHGTIIVNGRTINVFSTHVSYASATDRTTQTNQVKNWAASWAENRIVMGDFNARPGSSDYSIMATSYLRFMGGGGQERHLLVADRNQGVHARRLQVRLYLRVAWGDQPEALKAWVVNSSASDHLPLVASFALQ